MKNLVIKNKFKILAVMLALIIGISACAASASAEDHTVAASTINTEELFSDRDYETEYDEDEAISIELNGESVTISEEGTYIISGTIEDGSIIIDAEDAKVQLILDNCSITSTDSAAIYVKDADKVFITTAEGSVNHLTNTTGFVADGDTNVDAVIFSKDDLTLNGEGTLIIESADNGICSKDELVITSGSYEIEAGGHGLQGKDDIAISGGDFTITSGEDAIHAKNSDDASLGYVVIEDGTFTEFYREQREILDSKCVD